MVLPKAGPIRRTRRLRRTVLVKISRTAVGVNLRRVYSLGGALRPANIQVPRTRAMTLALTWNGILCRNPLFGLQLRAAHLRGAPSRRVADKNLKSARAGAPVCNERGAERTCAPPSSGAHTSRASAFPM